MRLSSYLVNQYDYVIGYDYVMELELRLGIFLNAPSGHTLERISVLRDGGGDVTSIPL